MHWFTHSPGRQDKTEIQGEHVKHDDDEALKQIMYYYFQPRWVGAPLQPHAFDELE